LAISPDHRFVSPALWDLNADFAKEDAKMDAQLRSEAAADHPPVMGRESAPVTLVLFSDFQCPYCAGFFPMLTQFQKENPDELRVVFRNNPLAMHRWAKSAARSGICVAQQGGDVFWRFQDFLFSRQKETTPDNLGDMINQFLQTDPQVRTDKYVACMATPFPETRLDKDMQEVAAYRIHSTPTMFINGHKYGGFATADDFAAAVRANLHTENANQPAGSN
jgi:protein-disulfide isomerase